MLRSKEQAPPSGQPACFTIRAHRQSLLATLAILVCSLSSCGTTEKRSWSTCIEEANQRIKAKQAVRAEALYLEAEDLCEKSYGKEDVRTGTCLAYLAELYRGEQEYIKAARIYRRLIAVEEKIHGSSADLERWRDEYAHIRQKMRKYGIVDAEEDGQDASRIEPIKNLKPRSAEKSEPEKADEASESGKAGEHKIDVAKPEEGKPAEPKSEEKNSDTKSGPKSDKAKLDEDDKEDQEPKDKQSAKPEPDSDKGAAKAKKKD
jgi:hypothetical protein